MREQLVAWAEDCRLQGEVDLGGGRISDLVNDADLLTFHSATLVALDDGHIVRQSELEVGDSIADELGDVIADNLAARELVDDE